MSRLRGRRTRIGVAVGAALVMALSPAVASPASAHGRSGHGHSGPIDVERARTVGRAAETNGINGIYVSPHDGYVYAASVGGDEITVHDPRTGHIIDRIGGPEDQLTGPDDVFITEDGTLYWTEILTGYVGRLDHDTGEVTKQFVGQGVNPITMSDDGRLFVGLLFFGSGLWELDPDLDDAVPPRLLNGALNINAFDFGPDGYLYAPSIFTGEVLKIDVDDAMNPEVVASGFLGPSAVKIDSQGDVHVAELAEGRVWKLDLAGGNHEVLVDIEGTIDNIAFSTSDVLYVAAGADNQILRRNKRGRVNALSKLAIGQPGGVAVTDDGTVWVADFFSMRGFETRRKHPSISFYDRFAPPGVAFSGAGTVSADGNNVIISSGFANSVQVIDPSSGSVLTDVRTLAAPTNAIRHGDKLVATQLGAGNVVNAEDPTEVFLDGLFVPLGLASDGDTLYVGDWASGLVWAVDAAGPRVLVDGLAAPEGLAVDGDRLLVVETGLQQVTAIDLATGDKTPAVVGLDFSDRVPENFFPFGLMSGVAATDRAIYVSDDGVNTVYELRKGRRGHRGHHGRRHH